MLKHASANSHRRPGPRRSAFYRRWQREHYLNTLRVEAERLTHLVENVLAYARLERGRARGRVEVVAVDDLVAQVEGRLRGRAEQASLSHPTAYVESTGGGGSCRRRRFAGQRVPALGMRGRRDPDLAAFHQS